MADAEQSRPEPQGADFALLTRDRMPDRGPRYTETPPDPYAADAPLIAEPWNTVTAALFIGIVAAWAYRLRGRWRTRPFLCACLVVLLAGGLGGTLYHATRVSVAYFLLDVIPISLLGLAGAIYLLVRIGRSAGAVRLTLYGAGAVAFYLAVNLVLFPSLQTSALGNNPHLRVNLSYASLAVLVLTPLAAVLVRTRFRHGGWVVGSVVSFAIAWFFRLVDHQLAWALPMGSHWLWHTFGAATTAMIFEYFDRLEGEELSPSPPISPEGMAHRL